MTAIGLSLVSGLALFLTTYAGPVPRDATTHKPSPAQCAAATRDGRALVGCVDDQAGSTAPSAMAPPQRRPIVCPGDQRCPR